MADDSHLPIAVRRTRRSSAGPLRDRTDATDSTKACVPSPAASLTSTPKKSKKRVRFSDPGPILANLDDEDLSTGLTPIIRRASLSSRKKRRHSTPLRHSTTPSSASGIGIPSHDGQGSPFSGEVHFLPLRQVLDGRVKRRIRRNGLSEEMNVITAEKKRLAQETKAEIERLKAELAEKDDEIHRLHDETVMIDSERVWELEQQVAALKRELASRSGVQQQQIPLSPAFEWTAVARDPFSDDFMDLDAPSEADTEAFGEETMAELLCSTPTRRARDSFPTPPTTSPPRMLATPCTRSSPSQKHVSVQAALPDPEKQRLELELASLKLEISKLTTTLESYSSLTTRIADKLGPYSPHPDSPLEEPHSDLESRLRAVLQLLSDRTAALSELSSSLAGLGFPGSDASEVITSISSAFRTARLELEYLTPGEVSLPLTAAGAAVLDLLLTRLRELGKKSKEAEETIDEYHSIELSLRQQLGARVDAMDELKKDISTLQADNSKKDSQIIELEVGLERLKGAVSRYTRDVAELETLVQKMEDELATCNTSREKQRITIQRQDEQLAAMSEQLEHKLSSAAEQTSSLRTELASVQDAHQAALSNHTSEMIKLNKSHGSALALRDARVAELRLEIDRVNSSLRSAHEMIRQLRVDNSRLAGENGNLMAKVEMERGKAKEVIDCMRDELKRVVRLGESFSVDGDEPASAGAGKAVATAGTPSGLLSGELGKKRGSSVSLSASRKKRRCDSGLGFLDEEEVDVEV
ncbi:myosin heavy chain, skeletal muscle, adult [Rhypophila decipiens]|uniref:Myosin heavy chain, skeletal muscle, adult n=1 Tax=Rhypophila decipiens TaxID=261697 RepID=A0AAN6YFG7_9PEZI|nr:myosin heavy chain, skeletal muscle, adult [Rhypophila decipiens]